MSILVVIIKILFGIFDFVGKMWHISAREFKIYKSKSIKNRLPERINQMQLARVWGEIKGNMKPRHERLQIWNLWKLGDKKKGVKQNMNYEEEDSLFFDTPKKNKISHNRR
mmetsp:Transcript_31912/g.36280  ORF Transcript_31912/g.36280 Transcript_31912/m.36280 type:complete len:111 (-) Transcript_31912:200-532(-)